MFAAGGIRIQRLAARESAGGAGLGLEWQLVATLHPRDMLIPAPTAPNIRHLMTQVLRDGRRLGR